MFSFPPDDPEAVGRSVEALRALSLEFETGPCMAVRKAHQKVLDGWEGRTGQAAADRLDLLKRRSDQGQDCIGLIADGLDAYRWTLIEVRRLIGEVAADYENAQYYSTLEEPSISPDHSKFTSSPFEVLTARYWNAMGVLQGALGTLRQVISDNYPPVGPEPLRVAGVPARAPDGWISAQGSTPADQLDGLLRAGSGPEEVSTWWKYLTPDQQAKLVGSHGPELGRLDGIPGTVRDTCNRARLDADIARWEKMLNRPLPAAAATNPSAYLSADYAIAAKLEAAHAVRNALNVNEDGSLSLLLWDPTRDVPLAAVASGDVDTATNVMVQTPGFSTTVTKDVVGWTTKVDGLRLVSDAMLPEGSGGSSAVVAWLGYEAPGSGTASDLGLGGWLQDVAAVTNPVRAAEGAESLGSFVRGIVSARDDQPPYMVISGHSYGSVVAGLAVADSRVPVNAYLAEGSPGMGSGQLRDGVNYYALELDADVVPDLTRNPWVAGAVFGLGGGLVTGPLMGWSVAEAADHSLGLDPLSVGERLSVQPGLDPLSEAPVMLTAPGGHSGYHDPGTMSQSQMAAVLANRRDYMVFE